MIAPVTGLVSTENARTHVLTHAVSMRYVQALDTLRYVRAQLNTPATLLFVAIVSQSRT